MVGAGEQEDGVAGLQFLLRAEPGRLETGPLHGEEGEAALVVDADPVDAAFTAVEARHPGGRGAEDEVVRGEHVLGRDRDPGPHALLPEDRRRGVLGADLGAQEHHRGGGDARDGNGGVRDRLR
jgi:hypothetical protein